MSRLKEEIAQQKPFSGAAEEAMLNLLRTADCVERAMQREVKRWNITATQYNVLRILRGAHPQGLPCSTIGDRMITSDPDITRLLARLKAMNLIRQERYRKDKRVVHTCISPQGLALLEEMESTMARFPEGIFGHFGGDELATLIRLLEQARSRCDDRKAVGCDGEDKPCPEGAAD